MESFTSLWWLAWIAVCKPLVAGGVICKPLVAYVDRRSQAFGGRWSHLQAFGGIRGSWQMESFTSLWWQTGIVVHKPLVADGVIYKPLVDMPLVAYVDRRVHAFDGLRVSSFTRIHVCHQRLVNDSICPLRLVNGDPRKPPKACKRRSTNSTEGL